MTDEELMSLTRDMHEAMDHLAGHPIGEWPHYLVLMFKALERFGVDDGERPAWDCCISEVLDELETRLSLGYWLEDYKEA